MDRREPEWADLMRAALAGDSACYDKLLRSLAAALRPAARNGLARAGRNVSDAEDIVQDILLAVHLKRHTWDPQQPLGPWVRAIARYKLIDALRRRGSRYDLPIEDFTETLAAQDGAETVPERDVRRQLETLPDRQREVLRTITIEGASIGEAAARLAMTPGAVRVALHRGLVALAARLRTKED